MSEPAFAAEPATGQEPAATPDMLESAESAELARRRHPSAPASTATSATSAASAASAATPETAGASATYRQPARRTAGVTGRGVVALILVATFLAGLLDMAISGHRGHLFGVVFVAASGAGALLARRRALPTAMISPPLIYCVLIGVLSLIDRGGLAGGFRTTVAFYVGNAFVTGAPAIWSGTALACLIGWYRLRR